MASPFNSMSGQPVSISASGLQRTGQGNLQRIICGTSTACVITIYDSLTASGTVMLATFPLTAGAGYVMEMNFQTGCYINIVSGTGTFTATFGP